jgi:hydroxypyruvate reductase 1
MMKPDAVLVNAARGPCIDEAALVKHMQENPDFRAGEAVRGPSTVMIAGFEGVWLPFRAL